MISNCRRNTARGERSDYVCDGSHSVVGMEGRARWGKLQTERVSGSAVRAAHARW